MLLIIIGCKSSDNDELTKLPAEQKTAELKVLSPTSIIPSLIKPNSVSDGMLNYESYFISKADGRIHGYIISVPLDYDPSKDTQYPLLVFMHGSGEKPSSSDYELSKLKIHGPHKEIYYAKRKFPAVIASIQMARWESEVNPKVIKEFIDVLTGVDQNPNVSSGGSYGFGKYEIDLEKLHLTGLSLGGNGVFKTAFSYPTLFASISEFAGYTGSQEDMSKIKCQTYIRHSSGDGVVSSQNAYNARNWINAANPIKPANFQIFNSNSHDSWTSEYSRTDVFSVYEWHFSITKTGSSFPVTPPSNTLLTISDYYPSVNSIVKPSNLATITMSFNSQIKKGTGMIQIKNVTKNESFQVYANWGMVSANGNKVSIGPLSLLAGNSYEVTVEEGTITDLNGNNFSGLSGNSAWKFSVEGSVVPITPIIPIVPELLPPTVVQPGENNTNNPFVVNSYFPAIGSTINKPSNGYIQVDLIFNRTVKKGNGLIKVTNITDNTSFDAYAHWGMVAVNSSKASIYPVSVKSGKTYSITIQSGTFEDEFGKPYLGLNNNTWRFTVN